MARREHSGEKDLLMALAHPLRRQILRAMESGGQISPRELADLLDQPLSNVSYHVNVLADCAALRLVDTEPVRGALQHFYRATPLPPWAIEALEQFEPTAGATGESRDERAT